MYDGALTRARRTAWLQPNLNPDCREGKHRACRGDAWDDAHDEPASCGCPCHDLTEAA